MISQERMLDMIYEDPRCDKRDDYYRSLHLYASSVSEHGIILEIGTQYGASALAMLCGSRPSVTVVCVDPIFATGSITYPDAHQSKGLTYNSSLKDFAEKITKHGFADRVEVFPDYSWNVFEKWNRRRRLDGLLIDGEHTYQAVFGDCRWLDFVRPGGWCAMDDWFDDIERATTWYVCNSPEKRLV